MRKPGLVAAMIASLAVACSKSGKPPPPDPAAVATRLPPSSANRSA